MKQSDESDKRFQISEQNIQFLIKKLFEFGIMTPDNLIEVFQCTFLV